MQDRRDDDINKAVEKIVQRGIILDKLEGRSSALTYLAGRGIPLSVTKRVLIEGKRRNNDPS